MKICHTEVEFAKARANSPVVFIPTMGALHYGHLSLIKIAKSNFASYQNQATCVVVSIFVNRLQMGGDDQYHSYPRSGNADLAKLQKMGVDIVFIPTDSAIYPPVFPRIRAIVGDNFNILEGRFRPEHFSGVATVLLKLFNIIKPKVAIFGEKDYQQLLLVRSLVREFFFDIKIHQAPTIRDKRGLALSSRNSQLSQDQLIKAAQLFAVLQETKEKLIINANHQNRLNFNQLEQTASEKLNANGWLVDYLAIRQKADLQPAHNQSQELIILAAAKLGGVRLIDNLRVSLTPR